MRVALGLPEKLAFPEVDTERCPMPLCLMPLQQPNRLDGHGNEVDTDEVSMVESGVIPAFMKQMALQLINEIPGVDIQIYTDGIKNEENQSGSGIYFKTPREVRKIKLRNPDNCSVFRSELLAIEAGLEAILNENNYGAVWILSDSRSSIQHLKDWNNVGDRNGISILKLLRHIGVDHEVHLQWIPSHVDIYGNEVADNLAKQGTAEPLCSTPSLTFDEIYSIRKNKDLKTWRVPPSKSNAQT
ncbi:hypothetical protein AVEN_161515-1 [Araneus ventricosus]|uniref:ribonuclease H n=1 Tax=Araneus ventricosus TaxID=182803 RepID=A0A4Y2S0W3_ARAVE|nr:hypothetical protein AVEN_161515-1 [Araneus ventricosus]